MTDIPSLIITDDKGDIVTTRGVNAVRSDPSGMVCHLSVCYLVNLRANVSREIGNTDIIISLHF